jgi:anti-sigma factor RsiW
MSAGDVHDGALHEDALSAYVDGELDDATRADVEVRLAESDEWRAILEELRETRGALRSLPPVEAVPEFWTRVLAGDDVADLAAARRAKERRSGRWKVVVAGAAAAAVIVVGVVAIPQRSKVTPAVATFTNAHAARSSLDDDVVSSLASIGVPGFTR